jgi:hypothetical protein
MGLSEVTRREGIPLLAYSPLAFGHLSAKYLSGAKPAAARPTRFPYVRAALRQAECDAGRDGLCECRQEGESVGAFFAGRLRAQPLVLREHRCRCRYEGPGKGKHCRQKGYFATRRPGRNRRHSTELSQSGNLIARRPWPAELRALCAPLARLQRFDRSSILIDNPRFRSEGFPSGQRDQTVNLTALPSKVRILPPPPKITERRDGRRWQVGSPGRVHVYRLGNQAVYAKGSGFRRV